VAEQVLDAVLQRRGRARAAGAGALHVEVDDALTETVEGDIAAVLRHGRPDAGIEKLLDGGDDLLRALVEEFAAEDFSGAEALESTGAPER